MILNKSIKEEIMKITKTKKKLKKKELREEV